MVLLAAKDKNDPGAAIRIARFVDTLFPRFAELQASDRHPKWREVNLAATLAGLQPHARSANPGSRGARPWPPSRSPQAPASSPRPPCREPGQSRDQKEALFKKFIEWQRSSRTKANPRIFHARIFSRKRERKEELAVHVSWVRFEGTSAPTGNGGRDRARRALVRGRVEGARTMFGSTTPLAERPDLHPVHRANALLRSALLNETASFAEAGISLKPSMRSPDPQTVRSASPIPIARRAPERARYRHRSGRPASGVPLSFAAPPALDDVGDLALPAKA